MANLSRSISETHIQIRWKEFGRNDPAKEIMNKVKNEPTVKCNVSVLRTVLDTMDSLSVLSKLLPQVETQGDGFDISAEDQKGRLNDVLECIRDMQVHLDWFRLSIPIGDDTPEERQEFERMMKQIKEEVLYEIEDFAKKPGGGFIGYPSGKTQNRLTIKEGERDGWIQPAVTAEPTPLPGDPLPIAAISRQLDEWLAGPGAPLKTAAKT
jgi:hypothetical protein